VELPILTSENTENGFYKYFDEIDEETRKVYQVTIDIQSKIIQDLLTRSMGSKVK